MHLSPSSQPPQRRTCFTGLWSVIVVGCVGHARTKHIGRVLRLVQQRSTIAVVCGRALGRQLCSQEEQVDRDRWLSTQRSTRPRGVVAKQREHNLQLNLTNIGRSHLHSAPSGLAAPQQTAAQPAPGRWSAGGARASSNEQG